MSAVAAVWQSPGRVAFSIGGFEVMWYGICIAAGILVGFYFIYRRAPLYHGISQDRAFNLVILILIAALVGLRVYYVAFRWDYYSQHLNEILNIREGGLAIHGGLIFGIIMAFVLSRLWKESVLNILDLFFVAIPLGQAIGRWGNFFNSEAHGGHTDLPWAVFAEGDTVHPAFLYESIWCLFLFFLLMKIDNHRRFVGQPFFLYMILYSVERFFVEGLRTDNLMVHFPFGDFRQAQVISLASIVAGAILYVVFYRKQRRLETAGAEAAIIEDAESEGSKESE
ncbi:MAG: prolipoprotein diacylglyceryl transferase [Clostridiales Family XIII bacterium]|nr:prolipoprotein diacylglyceryl transferase [Clostridiales Family XIII bacterium]